MDMHIRNAPDSFQLTMVRHPEYDDRFSRYIEAVKISETPWPWSSGARTDSSRH
jgi:hypothetical protein